MLFIGCHFLAATAKYITSIGRYFDQKCMHDVLFIYVYLIGRHCVEVSTLNLSFHQLCIVGLFGHPQIVSWRISPFSIEGTLYHLFIMIYSFWYLDNFLNSVRGDRYLSLDILMGLLNTFTIMSYCWFQKTFYAPVANFVLNFRTSKRNSELCKVRSSISTKVN